MIDLIYCRVIASYLQCVVAGRFSELPITSDYGSESPRSGLLKGPTTISYLKTIGPEMGEIRVIQYIVEGDFVTPHFGEVTALE